MAQESAPPRPHQFQHQVTFEHEKPFGGEQHETVTFKVAASGLRSAIVAAINELPEVDRWPEEGTAVTVKVHRLGE